MKHPKNPAGIRRNISTGRVGEREREKRTILTENLAEFRIRFHNQKNPFDIGPLK